MQPCTPPAQHAAAECEHPGLSASPPTPQHGAPSAEPPNLGLQATVTWAQEGGPASWAASAEKKLHLICYRIKTENTGAQTQDPTLFNILQVISFWRAGGGGRRERKSENPHYVGKWLEYQQGKGYNQRRLNCSVPAQTLRRGGRQEGPSSSGVRQQDSHLHRPFFQGVTLKRR